MKCVCVIYVYKAACMRCMNEWVSHILFVPLKKDKRVSNGDMPFLKLHRKFYLDPIMKAYSSQKCNARGTSALKERFDRHVINICSKWIYANSKAAYKVWAWSESKCMHKRVNSITCFCPPSMQDFSLPHPSFRFFVLSGREPSKPLHARTI